MDIERKCRNSNIFVCARRISPAPSLHPRHLRVRRASGWCERGGVQCRGPAPANEAKGKGVQKPEGGSSTSAADGRCANGAHGPRSLFSRSRGLPVPAARSVLSPQTGPFVPHGRVELILEATPGTHYHNQTARRNSLPSSKEDRDARAEAQEAGGGGADARSRRHRAALAALGIATTSASPCAHQGVAATLVLTGRCSRHTRCRRAASAPAMRSAVPLPALNPPSSLSPSAASPGHRPPRRLACRARGWRMRRR